MRVVVAALCAMLALAAWAKPADVAFNGESFAPTFENTERGPDGTGHPFVEFTLPGETVDNWTQLFAYHDFADLDVTPDQAVAALGDVVKEQNKDANFAITEVPGGQEAIIDFLTWTPGSDVMEFNVFKYVHAREGNGLIAIQYAQRLNPDKLDVMAFREFRKKAVEEMMRVDPAPAQAYFAPKTRT